MDFPSRSTRVARTTLKSGRSYLPRCIGIKLAAGSREILQPVDRVTVCASRWRRLFRAAPSADSNGSAAAAQIWCCADHRGACATAGHVFCWRHPSCKQQPTGAIASDRPLTMSGPPAERSRLRLLWSLRNMLNGSCNDSTPGAPLSSMSVDFTGAHCADQTGQERSDGFPRSAR